MLKLLTAFFFFLLVFLVGVLPFRLVYALSDILAFFLNYIAGYRKGIIKGNLALVFPGMPEREKKLMIEKIYSNLSDIFLEGIKAFMMTRDQVNQRHRILNPEILDPCLEAGRSIIIVTGHYGNWEWGAFSAILQTKFNVIGFYKPIQNRWINGYIKKSREKYGTVLASIYETSKTFEESRHRPTIYLMAADQSPRSAEKAVWVEFLGRETAFLHGPEKYSRQHNHVVIYVDIRRAGRGSYTLLLSLLAENPADLAEGEITRRFARKLDSAIREEPYNWLWSHKRWKLSR